MRVLVLAPHPDDDVLGCGGTLLHLTRAGAEVTVVYVTSGESGGLHGTPEQIAATREEEAGRGAALLGYAGTRFLRHREGAVETSTTLVPELVDLVREVRPDLAFLPHARDGHVDHVATHRAGMRAIGAAGGPWFPGSPAPPHRVPTVLAYEVWTPLAAPGLVRDVTDVHEVQVRALLLHASQVGDFPYEQFLTGLSSYRGALLGHGRLAEAFEVVQLPSSLPLELLAGTQQRRGDPPTP